MRSARPRAPVGSGKRCRLGRECVLLNARVSRRCCGRIVELLQEQGREGVNRVVRLSVTTEGVGHKLG